jgi:hypothetical protein
LLPLPPRGDGCPHGVPRLAALAHGGGDTTHALGLEAGHVPHS